ncbi:FIST signal transduction protein [Desulfobotulus mexicanus]|uniref:Histidine kinase n=1 Tax=Desulfobotulus mexicanus TaxID=2586642 RepID=A0A5S5MDQ7_9BACT|nr:FIST C-terminal domain-containing protein [Desulfobotulus mexicanus]TYT73834.1 histidine kinase [Desulfobotulus mexicanus]
MIVKLCREGKSLTAEKTAKTMASDPRVKALLILACDANGWKKEEVDPWLKDLGKPVFGGIFPQIIAEGKNLETGTLVIGLSHPVQPFVLKGISRPGTELERELEALLKGRDFSDSTIFVFVDGMARRIGELIEGLFNTLGLTPSYIGGGAGSLNFTRKPCIISPEGLLTDAVILAHSKVASGIGVAHGWHAISEAIKVTEASQNRILSLNWQPALQVYRSIIEKYEDVSFDKRDFFDIAKAYPLGIARMDAEMVVRDPILTEYDALICVGEVPEGSYIHILNGNMDSLISGALEARKTAMENYRGREKNPVLFFMDCISRVLFMGSDFKNEIAAVEQNSFTFGALSLGEIANTGEAFLEFYNKTAVAGFLGDAYEP